MKIAGALIAESLRRGKALQGVSLGVTKIARGDVGDVDAGQPLTWTFIEFEAPADDGPDLAIALSRVLEPAGGWYCDFRTDTDTYVVFADRVFRYPRGDREGRQEAEEYAREVGVPESQLDWPT